MIVEQIPSTFEGTLPNQMDTRLENAQSKNDRASNNTQLSQGSYMNNISTSSRKYRCIYRSTKNKPRNYNPPNNSLLSFSHRDDHIPASESSRAHSSAKENNVPSPAANAPLLTTTIAKHTQTTVGTLDISR